MTEKKSKKMKKKASFEESLDELDMIIHKMESRDLGLTESLTAYEQGVSLLRHLHEELSDIEQRVVTLVRIDEDGNPVFDKHHVLCGKQISAEKYDYKGEGSESYAKTTKHIH